VTPASAAPAEYRRYDFKTALLHRLFTRLGERELEVLDLGSGTSKDWVEVLQRFPGIRYTGVEYREAALERARTLLAGYPGVTLLNGFGEEAQARFSDRFDVTLSLSVLEHVKHLDAFLRSSVRVTRPGGTVLHRYDLGHALHSGPYERSKVWLCRRVPALMPARHFTTHPVLAGVVRTLEQAGVEVTEVAHSQLTGHKQAINRMEWGSEGTAALARDTIALDERLAAYLATRLSPAAMERAFPTLTVTGTRR
jgi:SAM-dependent methyltransferase